jgi:hypothetical protein
VQKQEINFKEMLEDITGNLKYMSSANGQQVSIVLNNLISLMPSDTSTSAERHSWRQSKPLFSPEINLN